MKTYAALTDQMAYDVALIKLAQRVGIECSASEFDVPERARAMLERTLFARGIPVSGIVHEPVSEDRAATEAEANDIL